MKNTFILIIILVLTNILVAQIPPTYYDDAEGLTGEDLKTGLYDIIKGHIEFPYTSDNTDVWDILKETDKDPNNENNVILLYTGWSVDAEQEYNGGSGWTREHVWSKSHGDFGTTQGPGTDVHHLRPADVSVNSAKGNRWFDNCSTAYYDAGVYTGCFKGSSDWVWQPREEVKGDVARMIFYMATRYEGENGEPDLEIVNYLPTDNDTPEPIYARLNTLLQWNIDDPVDDWERNRNNIIYYNYQHNRNPFIDHPEYVAEIWGAPTTLSTIESEISIFPNPTSEFITIKSSSQGFANVYIYDVIGSLIYENNSIILPLSLNLKKCNSNLLFVKIIQNNATVVKKVIVVD